EAGEEAAEGEVLDLEAVPAVGLGRDELVPAGVGAHGGEAGSPRAGEPEGARDRELVRPGPEGLDDDEVAPHPVVDARDAPGEVEVGLDPVERRVGGGGD